MQFNVFVINNGIKIYREVFFPIKFSKGLIIELIKHILDPDVIHDSHHKRKTINLSFELGVLKSHLRITRQTDRILAIGLGIGTTLIPVVKEILDKSNGFYTCIESSQSQIERAKKNIEINKIDNNKYKIINAFAGDNSNNSYGQSVNEFVNINDFEFDVLELDCEGCELSTLQNLSKRPRAIIVELHPLNFDSNYNNFDTILNLMSIMGYKLEFCYGHNGDFIDNGKVELIYNSISKNGNYNLFTEEESHFFTLLPLVCTFILKH